jgi:hypothetical protein
MTPGQTMQLEVELRSVTGAVRSRVRGAPLGSVEADVLTWSLAQWVHGGCPQDGAVRTTLHQVARALYGDRAISRADRRRVAEAIDNLKMAVVTLPDAKPTGPGARFVDISLVKRIHYGDELRMLRDGESVAAAALGALRDETLVFYIDDYLVSLLSQDSLRAWLDFPVQRKLGSGMGKRLWLVIESHGGYRPSANGDGLEAAVLELTDEMYEDLGARCKERRDNRKVVRRGIEKILATHDRYIELVMVPRSGGRSDLLKVLRRRQAFAEDRRGVLRSGANQAAEAA